MERSLQAQLDELQAQLAFQEDAIQVLDKILVAQQQRMEKLEQSNIRLEQQYAEMLAWLDDQPEPQVPPHY